MASLILGTSSMVTTIVAETLIKTLYGTTVGVYSLCSSVFSSSKANIKNYEEELIELDLINTVKIYEQWIKEVSTKHDIIEVESIKMLLEAINENLRSIHKEMDQIKIKTEEFSKKWLQSFRSLELSNEIKEIKKHKKLLDGRFSLLLKLVKEEKIL